MRQNTSLKRFNEEFFTILTEKKQTLPSGKYATLCANFRRSGSRWLFKIKNAQS
ncbi:hypothetical protein FORC80_0206 [Salmonella enterica subsp. enterica serovar Virchow]|nr:hypothetical protein FORC80_0206 [Salmonella enterica subsp. enterica serovar Virchow]